MEIIPIIIGAIVILGVLAVIGGCVIWIVWGVAHHFKERQRERAQHEEWLRDVLRRQAREKLESQRDRESIAQEYHELIHAFARLISDGTSPWDEMVRTARALHGGTDFVSFKELIEHEVKRILVAFSVANGNTPDGLGRLYHALLVQPDEELTVENCIQKIGSREHQPVELPGVIVPLSSFDSLRGAHLASDAADAYLALVMWASESCSPSVAVDALKSKYITFLRPYAGFSKNVSQSSAGNHTKNQSGVQFNGNCPECAKFFPVLRLRPDAGEKETKTAYRNFVKIYHPDRLEGRSERQAAQEELKQVNEAYSHIVGHFEPVRP